MKDVIVSLAFACIFLFFSFVFRKVGKKQRITMKAYATIYNISHYDADVNYYVKFEVDGNVVTGKSIPYRSGSKSYACGDCVPIEYYFTKAGWARVTILDDEMKAFGETAKIFPKFLMWISVVFFALATIFLLGSLI